MTIIKKLTLLTLALGALTNSTNVCPMFLQDIHNTATQNIQYVLSLPKVQKMILAGSCTFSTATLYHCLTNNNSLGHLSPALSWVAYSGSGLAWYAMLNNKNITKNEFLDYAATNQPEKIISFLKNYHKNNYGLSIYNLIEHNDFQAINNALTHEHLKMALFLILNLHTSQDSILHFTLEDVIQWSALKNESVKQKNCQKLLQFSKFCSPYRIFYNQYKNIFTENLYMNYPQAFNYSPFAYNLNNKIEATMLHVPNDTQTVLNYFICACLVDHDAIAHYFAHVLKSRDAKWNVNDVTYEDESLLHHMARQNNPKIIKLLFELNHVSTVKNKNGLTPLDIARKNNALESISALNKQKSYIEAHVTLRKSFQRQEKNFNEKYLIKHIISYTTSDDFKHLQKNESPYIGLM